jgi:hypothetical protein
MLLQLLLLLPYGAHCLLQLLNAPAAHPVTWLHSTCGLPDHRPRSCSSNKWQHHCKGKTFNPSHVLCGDALCILSQCLLLRNNLSAQGCCRITCRSDTVLTMTAALQSFHHVHLRCRLLT